MTRTSLSVLALLMLSLFGCASYSKRDLAHYPFPEAQKEIRSVIQSVEDASTSGDVETLAA